VVNVDLLQSAAAVEIDLHAVRPLDRSAALLSPAIGLARPDWSQVPAGGV
jgi:hypothetical protein